jgi:hypothetical protein
MLGHRLLLLLLSDWKRTGLMENDDEGRIWGNAALSRISIDAEQPKGKLATNTNLFFRSKFFIFKPQIHPGS